MRVVQAPAITFTCSSCNAVCEGEPQEFRFRATMPPTWDARCALCHALNVVSPTPLIALLISAPMALIPPPNAPTPERAIDRLLRSP